VCVVITADIVVRKLSSTTLITTGRTWHSDIAHKPVFALRLLTRLSQGQWLFSAAACNLLHTVAPSHLTDSNRSHTTDKKYIKQAAQARWSSAGQEQIWEGKCLGYCPEEIFVGTIQEGKCPDGNRREEYAESNYLVGNFGDN